MASRRSNAEEPSFGADEAGSESPVVVPIEDSLDLHAFSPRDIAELVRAYLVECVRHGFREVRVIHGRGMGVQRTIVRSVLTDHPLVEAFTDAPPERGGWGATVVRLRDDPSTPHNDQ